MFFGLSKGAFRFNEPRNSLFTLSVSALAPFSGCLCLAILLVLVCDIMPVV